VANDGGGRSASYFNDPPELWNNEYEFSIYGRDIGQGEEFEQYMVIDGQRTLLNVYETSIVGRWTTTKTTRFYLKVVR
jgi:hypothetical protein